MLVSQSPATYHQLLVLLAFASGLPRNPRQAGSLTGTILQCFPLPSGSGPLRVKFGLAKKRGWQVRYIRYIFRRNSTSFNCYCDCLSGLPRRRNSTGVSAPLFAAFLKIAFLGVWGGGGGDNDVLVGRLF